MKFYADENFPLRTVIKLRDLGHDVLTAFEDQKANQAIADEEVLNRAIELERAILTLNRKDFKNLHLQNTDHFGIILCTEDADRARQAGMIDEKISQLASLKGELIRIKRPEK